MPAVGAALVLAVVAVFGRTVTFEFVNYDDNAYVYDNPVVTKGTSVAGVIAAFSQPQLSDWVPLTTLSHALDWQVFGSWAGGHHLVNVLLHASSSVLLFLVLRRMTGCVWRSALVAGLFALHPLQVEPVAWVTGRKDVLSGFFFMLTLGAYVSYVRRPGVVRYALVAAFLIMGLLSKAILITTPFLLLLLDRWPLDRTSHTSFRRLVLEKIPLLLLCGVVLVVGIRVNEHALTLAGSLPLSLRLANAVVSYAVYVAQFFRPANLAAVYPYPWHGIDTGIVFAAAVFLASVSVGAIFWRRKRPWFASGWLWYLGMLAPVIGLIPPGPFSRADRYLYLPVIGLGVTVAWAGGFLVARVPRGRLIATVAAAAVLLGCAALATQQTSCWRNSESLWMQALASTEGNSMAQNNLGTWLLEKGRTEEAITRFLQALEIRPDYKEALTNLGGALLVAGRAEEAVAAYQKAVNAAPGSAEAHHRLGFALLQWGHVEEAEKAIEKALALSPDDADARVNLGNVRAQQRRPLEALIAYREALRIRPDHPEAHLNLANALLRAGDLDQARTHFQAALAARPKYGEAEVGLGTVALQSGQLKQAEEHYRAALRDRPGNAEAENNLGYVLFRQGRRSEAVAHYRNALRANGNFVTALTNLSWALATSPEDSLRDGAEALELAAVAVRQTAERDPLALASFAAAQAECSQLVEAAQTAGKAAQVASVENDEPLADEIRAQQECYRAGRPFRVSDSSPGAAP